MPIFHSIYYDIELCSFLTERTQGEFLADYPKQRKCKALYPSAGDMGREVLKKWQWVAVGAAAFPNGFQLGATLRPSLVLRAVREGNKKALSGK